MVDCYTKCRVRKLKIRTNERSLLSRITFLMEDALRTASFPGIPPNGVVYIKSMDLGCFDSKISSGFLSNKIDSFIRNIRPVRAESKAAEHEDISAVWFADELEPYRVLTDQLAKGYSPKAWFWPVAVEGWSPQSPVTQSLEKIIFQVAQKTTGIYGLSYVLEPLLAGDKILDMFNIMEQKTLARLMSFLRLTPTLLFKEPFQIQEDKAISEIPVNPFDGLEAGYQVLVKKAIKRWGAKDLRVNLITCLGLADSRQEVSALQAARVMEKAVKKLEFPLDHPSSDQALPDYDTQKQRLTPSVQQTDTIDLFQENQRFNDSVANDYKALEHEIEDHGKEHSWPEQMYLFHPFAGDFSDYAGFPFLINVINRLGFEDILCGHDEYQAVIIAQQFLWQVALWQNIPDDDPVLRFLKNESNELPQVFEFKHPLNRQMIFEAARASVKQMFQMPQSRSPLQPLNFNQVIQIFVIAACRYIRKYAKISIRKLIKRPAYIALTKTHMDITTSMKNLDIRIRIAGLDINPGWVPWLGRVIQFHYTEDE